LPPVEHARDVTFMEFMLRLDFRPSLTIAARLLQYTNWGYASSILVSREDTEVVVEILSGLLGLIGRGYPLHDPFGSMATVYAHAITGGKISLIESLKSNSPFADLLRAEVQRFESHDCYYERGYFRFGKSGQPYGHGALLTLSYYSAINSCKAMDIFNAVIASICLPEAEWKVRTIVEIFRVLQSRGFLIPLPPCKPEYRDWFEKLNVIV